MFKGFFNHKLVAQISAVLLAFGMWLHVSTRDVTEVAISVPLELINFPANMVVADNLPEGISLRLRGPAAQTRFVDDRKMRFRLDLSEARQGVNNYTLSADSLGLPRGLTVSRLNPSMVTVNLEPIETKKVNILAALSGEPAPGFFLEEVAMEPPILTIKGPANILNDIDIVWSTPINIEGLKNSAVVKTAPVFSDHGLSLVDSPDLVARVTISELKEQKKFKAVPVDFDEHIEGYPAKVTITISGPVSQINNLKAENLQVKAVWPKGRPLADTAKATVMVTLPDSFNVLAVEPESVILKAPAEPDSSTP